MQNVFLTVSGYIKGESGKERPMNQNQMDFDIRGDEVREECGVFGIYDFDGNDVASTIYYGLFALQHRGQESCGIAVSDTEGPKGKVSAYKGMGPVSYTHLSWGRNARFASGFEVGTRVRIWGRVQSREYTKKITETECEKRIAYEVSISKLECDEI